MRMKFDARTTHFPYCLEKLEDGSYIVLNRDYSPVGFATGGFVGHKGFPHRVRISGLGPATAAKLSHNKSPDVGTIFLYNDGSVPTQNGANMAAYLKRLAILMKLVCESVDPVG